MVSAGLGLGVHGLIAPSRLQAPAAAVHSASTAADEPVARRSGGTAVPAPSWVSSVGSAVLTSPSGGNAVSPSPPTGIAIPALGVRSSLGPARGLKPDGTIDDAPLSGPTWSLPWWYNRGPVPGQPGSSVLLGHVDSASGEGRIGVFFNLGDLSNGQAVDVTLADGTVTRWVTVSNVLYSDRSFPNSVIYDPSGPPRLRLITCGGSFDADTGHYQSTDVVTAELVGV